MYVRRYVRASWPPPRTTSGRAPTRPLPWSRRKERSSPGPDSSVPIRNAGCAFPSGAEGRAEGDRAGFSGASAAFSAPPAAFSAPYPARGGESGTVPGPGAVTALNASGCFRTDFGPTNAPDGDPVKARPSREVNVRKFVLTKSGTSSVIGVPVCSRPGMTLPSWSCSASGVNTGTTAVKGGLSPFPDHLLMPLRGLRPVPIR